MQYYVHSHGFGSSNRQCLALLLKGLRQFDYRAQDDESAQPQPRSMWPDNTRVERPLGQLVYGLPQPLRPFGSPTHGRLTRPSEDANAGKWRLLARGQTVTLEPHIRVQKVSVLGHDQKDYFVFADHRFAEVDLQTHRVHWSLYTNRQEINYYKWGYYTPRPTGDGIDDLDQLRRAVRASKEFLGPELAKRVDELLTPEALAVMAGFGALFVASQLTPVGWAADAMVAVLVVGGCILMGPELLTIAQALNKFYQTATNAGNNAAKYREAGQYFAEAVSKIGFDVLLGVLLHKASVPLQRRLVRIKQNSGGKKTVVAEETTETSANQKPAKPEEPTKLPPELEKYTAQGLDRAKLKAAYDAAPDKAKFLADLEKCSSVFARQEMIGDFDNIPGVAKGPNPENGLRDGIEYIDKAGNNDPKLNLPDKEAANFSEANPVYLEPGTKLYRVVGGSARDTGGYWVTAENLPKEYGDVIGGTAVKPSWGNGMTEVIEYTVPEEGMVVWEGPAASQPIGEPPSPGHHLPGGDNQIYVPEVYRDYRKPEVLDKFKDNITKHTPIEWKR